VSGLFPFWAWLKAGGDFAEVLGQAGYRFPAAGFVLNAVHAGQSAGRCGRCGETGNPMSGTGRRSLFVTEGNFQTVGKARESNFQMRVRGSQVLERFQASLDDRGLQPSTGIVLEASGVGQKAGHAPGGRSQPGVSVEAHVQVFGFSGHG
jgi:hypothetical protein